MHIKTIQASNKNSILDVGMEKQQKQKLGLRVSVLPIPAFYCILDVCNVMSKNTYPPLVSVIFPSLLQAFTFVSMSFLPDLLYSKTFQPPSFYIEIATVISDTYITASTTYILVCLMVHELQMSLQT